jgi:hypothetical protein
MWASVALQPYRVPSVAGHSLCSSSLLPSHPIPMSSELIYPVLSLLSGPEMMLTQRQHCPCSGVHLMFLISASLVGGGDS